MFTSLESAGARPSGRSLGRQSRSRDACRDPLSPGAAFCRMQSRVCLSGTRSRDLGALGVTAGGAGRPPQRRPAPLPSERPSSSDNPPGGTSRPPWSGWQMRQGPGDAPGSPGHGLEHAARPVLLGTPGTAGTPGGQQQGALPGQPCGSNLCPPKSPRLSTHRVTDRLVSPAPAPPQQPSAAAGSWWR